MGLIIILWLIVTAIFVGISGMYYLYMKTKAMKPWNLEVNESYQPSVAILVPVHNEEKTISLKLQNLSKVQYPANKIDIVIVNDASTDNTLTEVNNYKTQNPLLNIKIVDQKEHLGKTECLNRALKIVNAEILIISDADCFWPSDILEKALSYLSDPNVGAITARELLLNPHSSWVTRGEQYYNSTVQSIRIGESKIHSTIFFQGGFAAYKREFLQEFNHETDDSGTALDIVQKNGRALLLPEIGFYTTFPSIWKNKVTLKIRRAGQLQHLWAKCVALLLNGRLVLPKKIAIPEMFLHLFNPLLFVVLAVLSALVFIQYPLLLLVFLSAFGLISLVSAIRITVLETLQSNLILLASLFSFFSNKQFTLWTTVQESRYILTEDILREYKLI